MAKITRFSKNGELGIRDRKDLGIDVLDSKGKQLCFFNEMGCVHLYYLLQQKMTEIDQSVKDKVAKQMKNWHVDEQHERFDPLGPDDEVYLPTTGNHIISKMQLMEDALFIYGLGRGK